jgi:hypothetical protein
MDKLYILLILILFSCNPKKIQLTKVDTETFNHKDFYPDLIDTIWKSTDEKLLIVRKTGRESLISFLVDSNNFYMIGGLNREEKDWTIKNDSIIVYTKPSYEHWSRFTGEYNGLWSELNINYSRHIFQYQKPESISELPFKYGIYKFDSLKNTLEPVENTDQEGIYYFTKYWNGVDEIISIDELILRKNR